MKILLSHRYIWPDTASYGHMLRSIAEDLAAAGHEVVLFGSRPSRDDYTGPPMGDEERGGVTVRRIPIFTERKSRPALRVLNVFIYCGALFWTILRRRPDLVTAATFPPVVAAWTASLAARLVGARFVYQLQDIHPEVSRYAGGRMGRGWLFALFRWLDNQTLRRADAIVVLSEDMADTLRARDLGPLPIHVINNFLLEDFTATAEVAAHPELEKSAGTIRVIFAGNLGRFQNLPTLAEGVAGCFAAHPELELMFLGGGEAEADLKARWGDHPQVRFAPFLPFSEARPVITGADLGLTSLARDVYRVAYPSKVLTYLGLGVPVLAMVEPDSKMADELRRKGWGIVPEAPTAAAITQALEDYLTEGASGPVEPVWTMEQALAAWRALAESLASSPPASPLSPSR